MEYLSSRKKRFTDIMTLLCIVISCSMLLFAKPVFASNSKTTTNLNAISLFYTTNHTQKQNSLHTNTLSLISNHTTPNDPNIETKQQKFYFYIDGELVAFKNTPLLYEDTTFVEIEEITNHIGATLEFVDDCNIAIIQSVASQQKTNTIELPLFSSYANTILKNGTFSLETVRMLGGDNEKITPLFIAGKIYVPLRFVVQHTGNGLAYFHNDQEIHIVSQNGAFPTISFVEEERQAQAKRIATRKEELRPLAEEMVSFSFTEEELEALDAFVKQYDSNLSIYYKDLATGYTYMNNAEKIYTMASAIKAPYCMYIYDLVSQGKADLSAEYTYYEKHTAGGAGYIQTQPVGSSYTLEELLGYTITRSDNVGIRILREAFGTADFTAYATDFGLLYPEHISNLTSAKITAPDAGIYMEAIYDFIQTNPQGAVLRTHMLNTNTRMIVSNYPVVRKFGWFETAFHDMAIVEAPNPYILCILSDLSGQFSPFANLSKMIESYSQKDTRQDVEDLLDVLILEEIENGLL
ncbi:MAG: serine hydrolase [Bacillota bacterium]